MEVGLPPTFTIWGMLGLSNLVAYGLEASLAYSMEDTTSRSRLLAMATQHDMLSWDCCIHTCRDKFAHLSS